MSELIQESKYITVQEFMPLWSMFKEIKEEKGEFRALEFAKQNNLSITNCSKCLIGEVFGGDEYTNGNTRCSECNNISLGKAIYIGNYATLKDFYQFKEELYDHYMEAHPEKLLRK